MKSIKVFLISVLLLPVCWQATYATQNVTFHYTCPAGTSMVSGVDVSEVIAACAEYLEMSETYLHEHLVSFVSLGYTGAGEEYGTITFSMDTGNETYNWRVEDNGGSNVIVIWPT
jgi:hypothetical protein